tara:strand:- start:926 stop:1375 length:450 start_codon:yes stop_codon:yes gene_type:complete
MKNLSSQISSKYGSHNLDKLINKLKTSNDKKRKYEYILWLGKNLSKSSQELISEENKVNGCISEVYIKAKKINGKIEWEGFSDALITKGLLAFLIKGLSELTPDEIIKIDNSFIDETGLNASLTPSRANGFLNIFLKMKSQAIKLSNND